MQKGYFLGVDIGTYSSKGVLVDVHGKIEATHSVSHKLKIPHPGFVEHDANEVWWHDFIEIVRNLLCKAGINSKDILSIGTSGIGPCVLPIDRHGKPLRPAILYGIDTRAIEEIKYLNGILGEEKIFNLAGTYLSSQAAGPKILWIRRNEPEIYKKARWFLTSQSYIIYKLTNKAVIDIYTASSFTPLFDVFEHKWISEVADLIVPITNLPNPVWSHEIVGKVSSKAADETGLAEGTPVIAGTTDAAAEAISVGFSKISDMMLMLGSSVFFIVRTPQIVKTKYFWSSSFVQRNYYVLLGGMSTGGSLTTWFRDQFAEFELLKEREGVKNAYEALYELASLSPKGSKGLIVLPYFEGERTPIHDPKAKGVIFGLTLEHTKGDLYRAFLEGIAYGIRHNLDVLSKEGVIPKRIILAGGGLKNPLLKQIIADVCDIELHVPTQQIGASYGDAFLAAMGIGLFDKIENIEKWVKIKEHIEPNKNSSDIYETKYNIFCKLYEQTKNLMHEIDSLQKKLV